MKSELQAKLHELFEYKDGALYWKHNRGSQKCKGKKAGTLRQDGYYAFRVRELGGAMLVHRAIWCMFNDELPSMIDHINCDRADNRIENLRIADREQNGQNRAMPSHNTSGVKNVNWLGRLNKWAVTSRVNNKKKHFGVYEDLELAELVAHEVRDTFHGEFARHN